MGEAIWSFQLFGFRVKVLGAFLFLAVVLALLFGLQDPLTILAVLPMAFVSILVHELGHAVVIRQFGLPVGDIVLHGMGGHVTHKRTTPGREVAISLAGPAAGLLLGGLLYVGWRYLGAGFMPELVYLALFMNIGWSIFNLFPILPLDGGNALRAGLSLVTSDRNAWRLAAVTTMALCLLGAVWFASIGTYINALLVAYFGYRGFQIYQQVA